MTSGYGRTWVHPVKELQSDWQPCCHSCPACWAHARKAASSATSTPVSIPCPYMQAAGGKLDPHPLKARASRNGVRTGAFSTRAMPKMLLSMDVYESFAPNALWQMQKCRLRSHPLSSPRSKTAPPGSGRLSIWLPLSHVCSTFFRDQRGKNLSLNPLVLCSIEQELNPVPGSYIWISN
jgi:hypothetical protein